MNEPDKSRLNRKNIVKLTVAGLLTITLLLFSNTPWVREHFSLENLNRIVDAASEVARRPYGPLLFVVGFGLATILYLPAVVIVPLGGLVYEFWEAFVLCWIGAMLGAIGTFLIARYLLEDFFKPRLQKSIFARLLDRLERDGLFTMIFLRLLFFLIPPINWAIGATGVRGRDYVLGTGIGIVPWILAILIAVRKLKTIQSSRDLLQPESLAMAAGFLVLFIFMAILKKRFLKQGEDD